LRILLGVPRGSCALGFGVGAGCGFTKALADKERLMNMYFLPTCKMHHDQERSLSGIQYKRVRTWVTTPAAIALEMAARMYFLSVSL
jgi:hypothetical protein